MKLIAPITLSLLSFFLHGQEIPYIFNISQEEYQPVVGGSNLTEEQVWDWTLKETVDIPFSFRLGNRLYDKLEVRSNGIRFAGEPTTWLFVFHSIFGGGLLVDRGTDQALSPILVKEESVGSNKALVIEWKNAGLRNTPSNSNFEDSFINYQIWLIENSNLIKVVFGPSLTYPENWDQGGPFTKLLIGDIALGLYGIADNPSYSFEDCTIPCVNNITGNPSEGVVYNFIPQETPNASTNLELQHSIRVYPNPTVNGEINLEVDPLDLVGGHFLLYDLQGKQIPIEFHPNEQLIVPERTFFYPGSYFLVYISRQGNIVFRQQILKR